MMPIRLKHTPKKKRLLPPRDRSHWPPGRETVTGGLHRQRTGPNRTLNGVSFPKRFVTGEGVRLATPTAPQPAWLMTPVERIRSCVLGRCLRAVQLTKQFGRRKVVAGVDILVEPGEVVALLGRNGAGKSTTFQMLAGQASPDSGDIQLDDRSILNLPAHARARLGLTYLPQERSVFLKLSAAENIGVPLEQRGLSRRDRRRRTEELLAEFGLGYAARMPAYALSGGEARKLEVARALATEPHIILLDEPFAGMDPIHVREVQDVILRLRDKGLGVLISDHNVYYAFEIIDRGYVIDAGRVIVEGPSALLATSAVARSAFLGDDFRVPPIIHGKRTDA